MNPFTEISSSSRTTSQMQTILDAYAEMGPLSIEQLTPALARQIPLMDRAAMAVYGQHFAKKALAPMPLPVGQVKHRLIPGPAGNILVRVYTPKSHPPEEGWPILIYFHGGGWVIATLDTYDSSCRALCDAADCIVISVHYRQAPEHPWPAATEDAFAAYQWICSHGQELGGNTDQIAIAGESAGGNLAAVVSQMARDQDILLPIYQLLIYPVIDLLNGPNSVSAHENADARPLNTSMLHWFYGHYIPTVANRTHPYISPIYASNFTDLPPATIILAEIDPLRSEGEDYATKLEEADVPVNLKIYEGVTHEFFGLVGLVKEANAAVAVSAKDLRYAFEETLATV